MTKTKMSLIAALIAAVGLWGAKIIFAPPIVEAAITSTLPIETLARNAPANLPDFDDKYQRHLGVLDTLKTP
jgi:hypothetical protein